MHPADAGDGEDIEDWCHHREHAYPQFQYWATMLELQLLVLMYVRSLQQASFTMYLDALTELVSWFHALNHTNYARGVGPCSSEGHG